MLFFCLFFHFLKLEKVLINRGSYKDMESRSLENTRVFIISEAELRKLICAMVLLSEAID